MLGLSYGELFLILGATAALIGPKDLPVIARTAGRLAGQAIGYVQLARGQLDNVMQQTQFRQVNKELQDTMAQLDAIRYEVRSLSIMNPGPITRTMMQNPAETTSDTGATTSNQPPSLNDARTSGSSHQAAPQQSLKQPYNFKAETSVFKEHVSMTPGPSDLHSQATTYARLAETQALKGEITGADANLDAADRPGLLSVLPVSAESAGLLPSRQGEATGSDIVLEALLEAEVARNAKEFFSQPQNQIKPE